MYLWKVTYTDTCKAMAMASYEPFDSDRTFSVLLTTPTDYEGVLSLCFKEWKARHGYGDGVRWAGPPELLGEVVNGEGKQEKPERCIGGWDRETAWIRFEDVDWGNFPKGSTLSVDADRKIYVMQPDGVRVYLNLRPARVVNAEKGVCMGVTHTYHCRLPGPGETVTMERMNDEKHDTPIGTVIAAEDISAGDWCSITPHGVRRIRSGDLAYAVPSRTIQLTTDPRGFHTWVAASSVAAVGEDDNGTFVSLRGAGTMWVQESTSEVRKALWGDTTD